MVHDKDNNWWTLGGYATAVLAPRGVIIGMKPRVADTYYDADDFFVKLI
jgi:hypothetical protein